MVINLVGKQELTRNFDLFGANVEVVGNIAKVRPLPPDHFESRTPVILAGSKAAFPGTRASIREQGAAWRAQACKEAGVPKLIHVSALLANELSPSDWLRRKAQGEEVVRLPSLLPPRCHGC